MKESLIKLYKQCFPEDPEQVVDYMFASALGEDNALVEWDGKTLACAVYLVEKTLYYKQNILPLPYIVALGTAISHRYKGYSEKLILRCLDKLYKENTPFVALYPFKHSFYQKYGFFIPSFDYTLTGVKKKCDVSKAKEIYDKFCQGLDYYIVRQDEDFNFIDTMLSLENGSFYEIFDLDKLVGYTNGEESIPVSYKKGEKDGAMVRIVNAVSALKLSKLTFDKKIKIKDNFIKENNFSCLIKNGDVEMVDSYDVEIDIEHLGEIIFGKRNLEGKMSNILVGYLADKY